MSFTARYAGVCHDCDQPFQAGTDVAYRPGSKSPVHNVCPDEPSEPLREHPVCQTCWLTHPVGTCDR